MLAREYDLSSEIAQDLARVIAVNYQLRHDADAEIRKMGLLCRAGTNGAPYANPAVSIRNKLSELIERQLDRLEKYKRQVTLEPLKLDDEARA